MSGVQHDRLGKRLPPFPIKQMTILSLCRICEPIAFMSIFPYVYFMVQDFKITTDVTKIAVYAGMVTSSFAFAEFSSGVVWGKLSDKIGRKPVLLFGLFGTALSMLIFGFAPSLPVALVARALGGLLNGNIGVLQTTVAEMITVKEHQPRAYTIMPFVWCLGSILGPALGGVLSSPATNYPSIFASDSIWARFPYLLPNLVCTLIVLCGVVVGILFLEETHGEKRFRRDPGLEAGKWILSRFTRCVELKNSTSEKAAAALNEEESVPLLDEDLLPGYRSAESSPNLVSVGAGEVLEPLDLNDNRVARGPKPAATKAFTKQVIRNIIGYGILAYHTMTFDSMLPTLLSTKDENPTPNHLPLQFMGSFGYSSREIGVILSVQGAYSMVATIFLFPFVVRKLGALGLFRFLAISYPLLYIITPYMVLLPENLKIIGVYALVIWKCTFATMAYPSNAILLTNSAPSLLMLGTINGVAASTASLSRAFGPTVSGILFSAGLKARYSGLAWWCSAVIALVGAINSLSMTEKGGRMDEDEKDDPEPALPEPQQQNLERICT